MRDRGWLFHLCRGAWRAPIVGLCCVAAAACGKSPQVPPPITVVAPPPVKAKATISLRATPGVNPTEEGRPSPIVVRLYQLRTAGAFNDADYSRLNGAEQATLGQDLIRRDDYTLVPGGGTQLEVELPEQAAVVCALAAFQALDETVWRACVELPATALAITVDESRVTITRPEF